MFAFAGLLGILIGVAGSAALVWFGSRPSPDAHRLRSSAKAVLIGGGVAFLALEGALLANDFSLEYVANHHSRTTPFPFNLATGWAALEGSSVLWGLVLAVYTWVVARNFARRQDRLGAGALAVMGAVGVFFFGLQLTVADPFRICIDAAANGCLTSSPFPWVAAVAPPDGPGPNPLLQNHILMAIHPPMLYLGYVGLTVPFAYAISALAIRQTGSEWLQLSRRSSLVAWTFLSLGIVLGAWWAYEVLSWGGYWAWDPVENASFMPWLITTAFLHSSLVQIRRRALQSWNFVLVIAAFSLTILGTFLTRSGTIASVHSFTQSAIGPVLLGFLFLVLAGSFALFAWRVPLLERAARLETFVSREGGFLLNNLLLVIYAFVVVTGTLYPILVEAISGDRVSVGEPFFNRLAVPLSFALLLMMGIGPLLPWRKADGVALSDRLRLPVGIALLAGLVTAVTISRVGYVVAAVASGVYVITVSATYLLERAAHSDSIHRRGLLVGVKRQLTNEPSFWAGQLSHAGVALAAIGLALAANLGLQTDVRMAPSETVRFAGYELSYRSPFLFTEPNRRVQGANVEVFDRDGRYVRELAPRANYFGSDTSGISTPAVHSTWKGDLYLTLLDIEPTGILLRLNTSPGIWLLWTGGFLVVAGGVWSLTARRHVREPVLVA
jgi:cytochrome c-type biogenesis protein CcmF